jgi:hypothetical protein
VDLAVAEVEVGLMLSATQAVEMVGKLMIVLAPMVLQILVVVVVLQEAAQQLLALVVQVIVALHSGHKEKTKWKNITHL